MMCLDTCFLGLSGKPRSPWHLICQDCTGDLDSSEQGQYFYYLLLHLSNTSHGSAKHLDSDSFYFFNFIYFIFGCAESSLLCADFLKLWQVGATLQFFIVASELWSVGSGWKMECKLRTDTWAVELQSDSGDQLSILVLTLPCTNRSLFLRGTICPSPLRQKWTASSVSYCLPSTDPQPVQKEAVKKDVGHLKDRTAGWMTCYLLFCCLFAFCQLFFGLCPPGIISV